MLVHKLDITVIQWLNTNLMCLFHKIRDFHKTRKESGQPLRKVEKLQFWLTRLLKMGKMKSKKLKGVIYEVSGPLGNNNYSSGWFWMFHGFSPSID